MTLWPIQEQAKYAIVEEWLKGKPTLLVLPTGGGKTHVFLSVLEECLAPWERALVTAHRSELLDQAGERMALFDLERPGYVQGQRNETDRPITLATVQTLARPGRLDEVLANGPIDYYVRDEAHRILSHTDKGILRKLRENNPQLKILGVTATPNRTDGRALGRVFESVAYQQSIKWMVRNGYLVPPVGVGINLNYTLNGIPVRGGDFSQVRVGRAINMPDTNRTVFKSWLKEARGRPTIGFTSTVEHAQALAWHFHLNGVRAAAMSGQTTWAEQAKWDENGMLAAFRAGEIQVLFNAYKLIEGVDVPNCSCIIWCRPTLSPLVFQQGVGRGLRRHPDKEDCLVLMFNPESDISLVNLNSVLDGSMRPLDKRPLPVARGKMRVGYPFRVGRAGAGSWDLLPNYPVTLEEKVEAEREKMALFERWIRGD